ncbi:DUF5983 family protein [Viridibacillus arvi]|uniref:DUF5983 family protein n=1 Tax=Viridibacillus arvi TaxID=263475 RepID=UPI0034CD12C1
MTEEKSFDINAQKVKIVETMLTVSTFSISEETVEWLKTQVQLTSTNEMGLTVYPKGDQGWFIPLFENITEDKDLPKDLLYFMGYAEGKNCTWLLIEPVSEISSRVVRYE